MPILPASLTLVALLVLCAPAWAAQEPGTRMQQLAPGVHAILHADANKDWPNSNVTVVEGRDAVMVVDSDYLPSAAVEDIERIRGLTGVPVRYLVNTHWHYDHINGNAEYRKAFPGLDIVAHHASRRVMDANAARFASRTPELAGFTYAAPTLTFEHSLTVDLGDRRAELMHFGRGNTPGDVVMYLPDQRILVTGDILVAPVPYAYQSYPGDWIEVLRRLEAIDARLIVPGHGPVMDDKTYLRQVRELLEYVVAKAHESRRMGRSLEETRRDIDLSAWRKRFAGDDPARLAVFESSIAGALVERAYAESHGGI